MSAEIALLLLLVASVWTFVVAEMGDKERKLLGKRAAALASAIIVPGVLAWVAFEAVAIQYRFGAEGYGWMAGLPVAVLVYWFFRRKARQPHGQGEVPPDREGDQHGA
jgi:hypothetical protein